MKADQKTLILLLPGFPKDEDDSACLPFQLSFARCIKRNYPGLNVLVLTLQYPFSKGDYFIGSLPVYSFGGGNKGGLAKLWLRKKIARKLESIRKRTGITVIISFWFGETALAGSRFAKKHPEIKHYCWLMGQDAKPGNPYFNKIKPHPGEVVALSDFLQTEFEKNYNCNPSTVIPPGVNPSLFGNEQPVRDIDILAAGSLISLKRFDIFINVVSNIKKSKPDSKVVLIGDGEEKNNLLQLIRNLNLQENINITGEIPHATVLQLMQRSKLLLHTSSYEGFGMVCLEALFAGAQVISFTKPLKNEIAGWHFAEDEDQMCKMATEIITSPSSSAVPKPEWSIEKCVDRFIALADLA
ncbi:MAG: glycosyltransferase [Chitinophagaceae bacterium]|nr:glycosyltransferase [Chitinophagaceae bacterium]